MSDTPDYASSADPRETIATACRILAMLGLVRETTGHVSARIDDQWMLIRCRGSSEAGLIETRAEAVQSVRFDGTDLENAEQYEAPTELPIHGEVYKARPEVRAVVHAHPRASMLCSIAKLELRPIYGSYDVFGTFMAADGVPIYPRSALIRQPEMGREMVAAMGGKSACLLYGHGIVTVGATIQEATIKAIQLETLASVTLECAKAGSFPDVIGEEDRAYFQSMRESRGARDVAHGKDIADWTWRHYVRLLEKSGF